MSGWHHTKESRKRISESNKNRNISLKTRRKISKSVKKAGFKWTSEMREAQRRRVSGNRCNLPVFYGKDNYMYGKKLSKRRRKLLSILASNRTGDINPNSKYFYCIYDTINKKNDT